MNKNYQCGNGSNESAVVCPELNQTLQNEAISHIKCGFSHNVAKTFDNEYYLWGNNVANQCLVVGKEVHIPTKLTASGLDKNAQIVDIYPGFFATQILTQ